MQKFEDRGGHENYAADDPRRELRPYRESKKTPEHHVEETAGMGAHQYFGGACVELCREAERHDNDENE